MNERNTPRRLKPLMIYDGECSFCRIWIKRWRRLTGRRVDYASYQRVAAWFPRIPREMFAASVVLIEPNGEVYNGAQAVFRSLAHRPGWRWPLWLYQRVPGMAWISEAGYRWVARHRGWMGKMRKAGRRTCGGHEV